MTSAERVPCPYCEVHINEPCTNIDGQPLTYSHTMRWEDYKNLIQYEDSIWQVNGNHFMHLGFLDGSQFVGHPHWHNKRMIKVSSRIDGNDENLPTNLFNSKYLYWVGWAEPELVHDAPPF